MAIVKQAVIYRLNALGWTQSEIGEVIGLAQRTISERLADLAKLPKLLNSLLDRGESVSDVAGKLKVNLTLAWTLALDSMDDVSRLKIFLPSYGDRRCWVFSC